jgi:DNA polymerase epsilon subunit 1
MRRQLLALLHVREFSSEAEFVDPCAVLVLPVVPCSHCYAVAPLDVTRCAASAAAAAAGDTWRCSTCRCPHSGREIESRLMLRLRLAVRDATQRDLRCEKCSRLSRGGGEARCAECGGELIFADDSGMDLKTQGIVMRSIAAFHGLSMLKEAAEWIVGEDLERTKVC